MNEFQTAFLNAVEMKMNGLIHEDDTQLAPVIAKQYLLALIKNLAADENREQLNRIIKAYELIEVEHA